MSTPTNARDVGKIEGAMMLCTSERETGGKPSATLSSMTFSGGQRVVLEPKDTVVLVGPNNSGKSLSLRDLQTLAAEGAGVHTKAVRGMELRKTGNAADLRRFLESKAELSGEVYRHHDWELHENHVRRWDADYLTAGLAAGFVRTVSAGGRLAICDVQASIAPGEPKTKPQHLLYEDPELMGKISGLFKRAFGVDIMFDFRGGRALPIHVGAIPSGKGMVDRVGNEYVDAVRAEPLLHEQGDGMKSYAGLLFETIVAGMSCSWTSRRRSCTRRRCVT